MLDVHWARTAWPRRARRPGAAAAALVWSTIFNLAIMGSRRQPGSWEAEEAHARCQPPRTTAAFLGGSSPRQLRLQACRLTCAACGALGSLWVPLSAAVRPRADRAAGAAASQQGALERCFLHRPAAENMLLSQAPLVRLQPAAAYRNGPGRRAPLPLPVADHSCLWEGNPSSWQLWASRRQPYVQAMAASRPFCLADRLSPINSNEAPSEAASSSSAWSFTHLYRPFRSSLQLLRLSPSSILPLAAPFTCVLSQKTPSPFQPASTFTSISHIPASVASL